MEKQYLDRFTGLCQELEIDPHKALSNPSPMLKGLIQQWIAGNIDDIGMMRGLRNLKILQSGL